MAFGNERLLAVFKSANKRSKPLVNSKMYFQLLIWL